jgi:hypothetical protein
MYTEFESNLFRTDNMIKSLMICVMARGEMCQEHRECNKPSAVQSDSTRRGRSVIIIIIIIILSSRMR